MLVQAASSNIVLHAVQFLNAQNIKGCWGFPHLDGRLANGHQGCCTTKSKESVAGAVCELVSMVNTGVPFLYAVCWVVSDVTLEDNVFKVVLAQSLAGRML